MFYKIVSKHIPSLYNLSKVKRVELLNRTIYLYYNYPRVSGNFLIFFTDLKEDYDLIECEDANEAKNHFDAMEKFLK